MQKLNNQLKINLAGLSVFASRFMSLPANFSPLGSFGFMTGNMSVFFLVVVVNDLLKSGLYNGFWLTYLGFAMYPLLGKFSQNQRKRQLVLLPAASFLFFLISNAGVWWYWRDHSVQGLLNTYILGLPFYRNTFLSDLMFGYGYVAIKSGLFSRLIAYKADLHELSKA